MEHWVRHDNMRTHFNNVIVSGQIVSYGGYVKSENDEIFADFMINNTYYEEILAPVFKLYTIDKNFIEIIKNHMTAELIIQGKLEMHKCPQRPRDIIEWCIIPEKIEVVRTEDEKAEDLMNALFPQKNASKKK